MEDKKNIPPSPQDANTRLQPNGDPKKKGGDENIKKAHDEAEKDIQNDAELSAHSPNDDLDEGETARLGEDNPLI
jgi:hypothetical protein